MRVTTQSFYILSLNYKEQARRYSYIYKYVDIHIEAHIQVARHADTQKSEYSSTQTHGCLHIQIAVYLNTWV